MIVVGLTGSIAMGKSETARMFAAEGVPVFEADAVVHALYRRGAAGAEAVERLFPGVLGPQEVDRSKLADRLAATPEAFGRLEAAIHPLVRAKSQEFLAQARRAGHRLVVLDVPLLFETQAEKSVDRIVVVTAPADIQRARVLARPGMTEAKLAAILARQMPDAEKRVRADFIVDSGQGLDRARTQVRAIVAELKAEAR